MKQTKFFRKGDQDEGININIKIFSILTPVKKLAVKTLKTA